MDPLTIEQLHELRKPFPASKISFKCQTKPNEKGNSLVVAYIDARDVMERLDDVMGPDWSDRYEPSVVGGLTCYLTVGGVTRADVGNSDNENEPVKSAYSDAFKRAAVKFGIGRFLYDLPKMWAKAKPLGKSFVLDDGEVDALRRKVDDFLAGKNKKPAGTPVTKVAAQPEPELSPAEEMHGPIPPQKPQRPYDPEVLKAKIQAFAVTWKQNITDGKWKFIPEHRNVLAACLGKVFPDDTQRYEFSMWITGEGSTKKMDPGYVESLLGWLECKDFNDVPGELVKREAIAAHSAALLASGQIPMGV